jgi:hypothetical protein
MLTRRRLEDVVNKMSSWFKIPQEHSLSSAAERFCSSYVSRLYSKNQPFVLIKSQLFMDSKSSAQEHRGKSIALIMVVRFIYTNDSEGDTLVTRALI